MGYYGNIPATGQNNSFKVLDEISSHTHTFDGSASAIVDTASGTIELNNHRFITGQRVTYTNGGGGDIGGITNNAAYYIIKHSGNSIKLATDSVKAIAGTSISLTGRGTGTSHTINASFDGVNTKFTATFNGGTKARITRASQLILSINGVIQEPSEAASPSKGFGIGSDSVIVFSAAPTTGHDFWGNLVADNLATFDISDNTIDNFVGNGSATDFNLSKVPANAQNILVTIDGVLQYPSDTNTTRAYNLIGGTVSFVSAPGNGTEIQVRHIGFAGATSGGGSGGVTGFYGRTGNVSLDAGDDIDIHSADVGAGGVNVSGIVTATEFVGSGVNLTGVSGFATALSIDQNSPLNKIFKTPDSLYVAPTQSVTVESDDISNKVAFMRESKVHVAIAGTFHVKAGTSFRPNILGISTAITTRTNLYSGDDIDIHSANVGAGGINVTGISTFSDNLEIYHNTSDNHSYIREGGTGNLRIQGAHIHFESHAGDETFAKFTDDGAVQLFYNDNEKIATTHTGAVVTGILTASQIALSDNKKATFGNDNDLEIYSDNDHSYLKENGPGALKLVGNDVRIENTSNRNVFKAIGTSCELFFDNGAATDRKLYTTNHGVNVGSAISMYASSGIVSATKYYGDGSELTGISAGGWTVHSTTSASGNSEVNLTSGLSDSTQTIEILAYRLRAGNGSGTLHQVQIGTTSAWAGTYNDVQRYWVNVGSQETSRGHDQNQFSAWHGLTNPFADTNIEFSGRFTLNRISTGNYIMESQCIADRADNNNQYQILNSGRVELGAALGRIRIFTADSTNFSAGTVVIRSM